MTTPLPGNTSQTARLMADAPGFAVGWQELVRLPSPAAGAQWSFKVDGRYFARVLAIQATFTASAVVATRFQHLILSDNNGNMVTSAPMSGGVAASTAIVASLETSGPAYSAGTIGLTSGHMPGLLIPPDWVWSTTVDSMDAGDKWSAIALLVQRFPNDAAMVSVGP